MTRYAGGMMPFQPLPINYQGFRSMRTMDPVPEDWSYLGVAPSPKRGSRLARFRWHIGHGLLMGYPLRYVFLFAIRGLAWGMSDRPGTVERLTLPNGTLAYYQRGATR